MSKKIKAVHPKSGEWEDAEVLRSTRASALKRQAEREFEVYIKFDRDGLEVEQPISYTDIK